MRSDPNHKSRRVAVVSHIWPHYRLPVMESLDRSSNISWQFYGSGHELDGIPHADTTRVKRFIIAPFKRFRKLLWQNAALTAALSRKNDAVIYLADPHFISNWLGAAIARVTGKPVIFWGHGWRRRESHVKMIFRALFYSLANHLFVYSERGRQIGVKAGYSVEKITVVYNSLNLAQANEIIDRIETGTLNSAQPQQMFSHPHRPLVICTARITQACRFEILLEAATFLAQCGKPLNLLLVGDGPNRQKLEEQAASMKLDAHFYGACFDEEIVGQLIYHADITVSPGKIGLTAMHSLMYGTPAITHDNLDEQMPEVEAIKPGVTGLLFRQNDSRSLANAISEWVEHAPARSTVREAARRTIDTTWNAENQAAIIEQAVLSEF